MKMIICASKIEKTELGLIIEKYPDAFIIKGRKSTAATNQHLVIIFFILHEMSKGSDSFWYPWF